MIIVQKKRGDFPPCFLWAQWWGKFSPVWGRGPAGLGGMDRFGIVVRTLPTASPYPSAGGNFFINGGGLAHFLAQGFPIFKTLFYFAFKSALNRFIKLLTAK